MIYELGKKKNPSLLWTDEEKKKQGSQRNIERKNDCSVADDFVKENVRS